MQDTSLAPVIVVPGPEALAETATRWIADAIEGAVRDRGACFLALAGGETPRGCYERLSREPYRTEIPWASVHVYWSDERRVPLSDPASNYAMARTSLLEHVPIPREQVFPMPVWEPDGNRAAAAYARVLERVPRTDPGWPRFDLILLGLGEDGHTASLFPGAGALSETRATVRAVQGSKPPAERLTVTLPVINAARLVLFLVHGAEKRSALQATRRRDPRLPAGLVQPHDGDLRFIVDREALVEDLAGV